MERIIAGAGASWTVPKYVDTPKKSRYFYAPPVAIAPALTWVAPVSNDTATILSFQPVPKLDLRAASRFAAQMQIADRPIRALIGWSKPLLRPAMVTPYGVVQRPVPVVVSQMLFRSLLPTLDERYCCVYKGLDKAVSLTSISASPWSFTRQFDQQYSYRYGAAKNRAITAGPYRTVFLVPEPEPVDPDPTDPDTPLIDKVYRIMNVINLVSLPDLTPVAFSYATLSRDIDSYAWTLNVTLSNEASAQLLSPKNGAIKEIRLSINGDVWEFFVAKMSASDRFAKQTWSVTAFSKSKLLSAPYSVQRSFTETSASTAAQIASSELFGTGFTLAWNAVDWSIPANVFTYSNQAPIASIMQLSNAIGAVVVPDPALQTITIKPRFEVSAWNWASATEDRTIPKALFYETSEEYQPQIKYNGVYVAGEEYGALVKVKQQGTPGDQLLPDVIDNLLTDAVANTERGRIELSKSGHKERFSGRIFYNPSEGFVDIGELVKIVDKDGSSWKGVAIANAITIEKLGSVVYQNLTILRHYE